MTERLLAKAILGKIGRGGAEGAQDIPEPYRSTVKQSRARMKASATQIGSLLGEPGEVVIPPISEQPTP